MIETKFLKNKCLHVKTFHERTGVFAQVRIAEVELAAGAGCRVQGSGCRVQGAGFRVQGAGCRVQGAGFRVQG